jgi:hypothetical protein
MSLGPYVARASKLAVQRSAADAGLERYLRGEYRGGTTFQAFLQDGNAEKGTFRAAVVRAVKQVLYDLRRVKPEPVPFPMDP